MTFSENFNERVLNMEDLIPTGSEERGVLGLGILFSCCNTSLLSRYENYCIMIT